MVEIAWGNNRSLYTDVVFKSSVADGRVRQQILKKELHNLSTVFTMVTFERFMG